VFADILFYFTIRYFYGAVRNSKIRSVDIRDAGQLAVVGVHLFYHPFGNIGAVGQESGIFFPEAHLDDLGNGFFEEPAGAVITGIVSILFRT